MIPCTYFHRRRFSLLVIALLTVMGCGRADIDTTYGKRRGASGGASVNGTAVLADMFRRVGTRVYPKRYLSPSIEEFDVIVWAPNDFGLPTEEQQDFFNDWLYQGYERTLVYIGRDYDAAVDYWAKMLESAPAKDAVATRRRLAEAQAEFDRQRLEMSLNNDSNWFHVERDCPVKWIGQRADHVEPLTGSWAEVGDLDAKQLDIRLRGRLTPRPPPYQLSYDRDADTEILLASGQDVLAWRITTDSWDGGQIVIVPNGSFLLNLPLVEKEHRKLAGKLIGQCGTMDKVAFLESDEGGPMVYEQEPGTNYPTGLEAFTVWPLGAILMHFVALGTLYVLSRFAIFGRPRELPGDSPSDFGKHVYALGQLLLRTQDETYARARLQDYQERTKTDSKT